MPKFVAIAVFLLVATGASVHADIYVWEDEAGVHHFTNRLEDVPEAYRAGATTVAKEWARPAPPTEPDKNAEDQTAPFANAPQLAAAAAAPRVALPPPPSEEDVPQSTVLPSQEIVQSTVPGVQPFYPSGLIGAGGPPGPVPFVPSQSAFRSIAPPATTAMGPPPIAASGPPPFGAAGRPASVSGSRR